MTNDVPAGRPKSLSFHCHWWKATWAAQAGRIPGMVSNFIILKAEFIICNAKFIILNTRFIIFQGRQDPRNRSIKSPRKRSVMQPDQQDIIRSLPHVRKNPQWMGICKGRLKWPLFAIENNTEKRRFQLNFAVDISVIPCAGLRSSVRTCNQRDRPINRRHVYTKQTASVRTLSSIRRHHHHAPSEIHHF